MEYTGFYASYEQEKSLSHVVIIIVVPGSIHHHVGKSTFPPFWVGLYCKVKGSLQHKKV